jgi:hypothetical protein
MTTFEPRLAQSRGDKAVQGIETVRRGHGSTNVLIIRHRQLLGAIRRGTAVWPFADRIAVLWVTQGARVRRRVTCTATAARLQW